MQGTLFSQKSTSLKNAFGTESWPLSRQIAIGSILVLALLAFEVFNFDTTRYALDNLLGGVAFAGLGWATILAVAFCAIDFAGLAHLFTPQRGMNEPKEVWFLMGAWLLGATMNAVMTWWAVSLTVLNHPFIGNEVLTRAQLLNIVPIFVAVLVWLTRIMFIGALSVAGNHVFQSQHADKAVFPHASRSQDTRPAAKNQRGSEVPAATQTNTVLNRRRTNRPPVPSQRRNNGYGSPGGARRPTPVGMSARSNRDDS
jgi:hypothetical protein